MLLVAAAAGATAVSSKLIRARADWQRVYRSVDYSRGRKAPRLEMRQATANTPPSSLKHSPRLSANKNKSQCLALRKSITIMNHDAIKESEFLVQTTTIVSELLGLVVAIKHLLHSSPPEEPLLGSLAGQATCQVGSKMLKDPPAMLGRVRTSSGLPMRIVTEMFPNVSRQRALQSPKSTTKLES